MENNQRKVNASIVLFKTDEREITEIVSCLRACSFIDKIFLIDNSPQPLLSASTHFDNAVEYIVRPDNPGYGTGHNIGLRKSIAEGSAYHLVLNSDLVFDPKVIDELRSFMEAHPRVAHVMPRVIDENGNSQYLCKLVPSPADLVLRRILPRPMRLRALHDFEMRWSDYDTPLFVPYLSGCFMLLRTDALIEVGLFDERFFMYPEDIDLTRRLAAKFKTAYYPGVHIIHRHGAASQKSLRMFIVHAVNIIKYFNKWGWLFDAERQRINTIARSQKRCAKSDFLGSQL
jgi:GT2 family glycosyltransferase